MSADPKLDLLHSIPLFARLGRIEVRHDSGSTVVLHVGLPAEGDQLREALRAAARRDVTG